MTENIGLILTFLTLERQMSACSGALHILYDVA